MSTTHPGVQLSQKTQGGQWNVRIYDPRNNRKQVLKSTETADFEIATRIAEELYRLIENPDHWDSPPDGLHARTLKIWGTKSIADRADEAIEELDYPLVTPPLTRGGRSWFVDWDGTLLDPDETRKKIESLLRTLKTLKSDRDSWKERAQIAEGQLQKMNVRVLRSKSAQSSITLEKARQTFEESFKGRDADYTKNVLWDIDRFVEHFGKSQTLAEMAGREEAIEKWLRSLTKKNKKPLGAGRRLEMRRAILNFLTTSGIEIRRKAISRPSKQDVRNDRGRIRWLSKKQATDVADKLQDQWKDAFRIQVGLGLRPDELITLKREDFSDDFATVSLSPLGDLTLKEGSRTIKVPIQVREIVERRLANGHLVFPGREDRPYSNAKNFDKRFLAVLKTAGKAANIPFKMDCRIGRRTCATLLLGAGVPVKTVADILGDDPATVLEHYGAVIPEHMDPTAAAI